MRVLAGKPERDRLERPRYTVYGRIILKLIAGVN
jgi:hypothetical protein